MSAQPTTSALPTACHIIHDWTNDNEENVELGRIRKKFKNSYAVRKFVFDMEEAKVWRGKQPPLEYPAERKKPATSRKDSASPPRKRRSPASPSSPLKKAKGNSALPTRKRSSPSTSPSKKIWTKEQRETATAKKVQEAADAACLGVRRSSRARVPTEKVLDA